MDLDKSLENSEPPPTSTIYNHNLDTSHDTSPAFPTSPTSPTSPASPASVTTCASRSRSRMWQNPTGDDWVSSAHECRSGVKVASSMTALAHWFPPPSLSGC